MSNRTPKTHSDRTGELALLRQIRARAAGTTGAGLRLGIGDDCALLGLRRSEEVAVTTDLSLAGRHFRLDWHAPETVGHRALARGLSDLASMGARPLAAFLSLGLPRDLAVRRGVRAAWVERFYDGLLGLAERHHTPLAGGDLAESPLALADIVLVGAVPSGTALLRSGARPGDLLYVTGSLGGAAFGLERLAKIATATERKTPPALSIKQKKELAPHLFPEPRLAQGQWLRNRKAATAAIDLSDGLSTDLTHLCEESGVAAEVDAAALPVYPGATLALALHGGEDYELLFAARPTIKLPRSIAGVPITAIGRVLARRRGHPVITLLTQEGPQPLAPRGWQHFA
ncbi:MAG: thiamine-phosphate kinase [Terracidiphilus sp.]|nr:thiamine-phosphate kinase [Terracidiphilus sp.]